MTVPFDQRPGLIWFDGKLVPIRDAKISVLTHGLHYASAVFEGKRAYGGAIFKGTEHSERLKRSAKILDFEIPYSVAEIDAAKRLVLESNNLNERLRAPDRLARHRAARRLARRQHNSSRDRRMGVGELFRSGAAAKGIRLDFAEYRRPDPATAPCLGKAAGLYMICTIDKHRAERKAMPTR